MNSLLRSITLTLTGMLLTATFTGCAAFRASTGEVSLDDPQYFDEKFNYADLREISERIANALAADPFLKDQPEPPIMMVANIQNRTSNYVDTKALTDRIRTRLIASKSAQFVNETRRDDLLKEQGYQAAHATGASQISVGKQLGAKYMLSGSLVEMKQTSPKQVRLSRKKLNYYNLTVEVTDLETGLIAWTKEEEFARQASQPLIGW